MLVTCRVGGVRPGIGRCGPADVGLVCDPCLQLGFDVRRHSTQADGEVVVGTVGGGARSV